MAMSFHVTALMPNKINDPSNCYSGLGQPFGGLPAIPVRVDKGALRAASVPGPESRKRVIVVGAGISGLRAASILYQNGIDVVVVEARDRIGGRIFTSRKDGYAKDIELGGLKTLRLFQGAAWMHETSQNDLVKLIPKLGIEYYYDDGIPLYYTEHGLAGAQFKAKKVADEFADYLEWYYDVNPDAEDKSVAEFAEEFVKNHLLITEDERAWAPQALREVELWIGTSVEEASAKHLSYFVTERNLYMKGGYDRVVNWTAQPLMEDPAMIRLNHVVEHVVWSENGPATVRCKDEHGSMHEIVGDAVVMTLPLGVYHHNLVSFNPPLPNEIQAGFDQFSYGALGKVFFEFEEMFWSKDNDQLIYLPSPESITPHNPDNILSFATVTINLWIMSSHKVLCVQIAEPLTQRIEAMTSGDEIYKFFEPLFKRFRTEPYKALPKLLNVETTHWTQDPYAGYGTYSADKVGDNPEKLIEALQSRTDSNLQFAGEHTTMVANGCVHGAFSTGERAAKNLLKTFGVACTGVGL